MKIFYDNKGVATLPTIMVITLLTISLGMALASFIAAESLTHNKWSDSAKAASYARTGAEDALLKLARNKNSAGAYQIELITNGCSEPIQGCASIEIGEGNSPKIITSEGQIGEIKRKVRVDLTLGVDGDLSGYVWKIY